MEISAAAVKAFRDKTGLPMMDCKRALIEAEGNEDLAIEILRKSGAKTMAGRTDRVTEAGRISLYVDTEKNITAMVELLCESAPVAKTDEFVALSNALAEQLAKGPGAKTAEELLAQPYPGKSGTTLQQVFDEQVNKIREVFRLPRLVRIEGPVGAYVHHDFAAAAVLPLEGANTALGRDIAMHVVAMKPEALSENDVPVEVVERERNFVLEQAKADESFTKKPENIQQKIIDGKMKSFFAERTLLGQQFVKDSAKTVAQVAEEGKIKVKEMIHWILGK